MEHEEGQHSNGGHYGRLLLMTAISFAAMYVLMYAMVDRVENALPSFNQLYMSGLMAAAMVAIELVVMGRMYPNRKLNALLTLVSVLAVALFWVLIRTQTAISDRQFVKSMIPHHSGAILMCRQASLADEDLVRLCDEIVRGQQEEIDRMKAALHRIDAK